MPGTVLALEGPSDVAAALTMGIPAVGRPSNRAGAEIIAKVLASRETLVVGENDQRITMEKIEWPGRDGAEHVSRQLANTWQKLVSAALPPKGSKDVRAWLNGRNLDLVDRDACLKAGAELLDRLRSSAVQAEPVPPELKIKIDRTPGKSKATVTAVVNDAPVHLDCFNPASSRCRSEFAKQVAAQDPRLAADDVEAALAAAALKGEEPAKPPS